MNESSFFQTKSNGKKYCPPDSEENGQCDAISDDYEMDFKTLISPSMARAESNTQIQIKQIGSGAYAFYSAKAKPGTVFNGSIILKALRGYTFEDIIAEKYMCDNAIIISDICAILKWLNTGKNLLIFVPSVFSFSEKLPEDEKQAILQDAMRLDVYKLFQLRKYYNPQHETFLCTIMEEFFVVFADVGDELNVVDVIDIEKCPGFIHLKTVLLYRIY